MLRKILYWLRSAHVDWSLSPCKTKMRRWEDGRWVYREMTEEEREEAEWWNAIR